MIYSYYKTNEEYSFLKFISEIGLYMFRTVSLSIKSLALQTAIGIGNIGYADCLLAGSGWNASQHNLYDLYLLLRVQF